MANWKKRALASEKALREDSLHTAVCDAEHNGLAEMARNLLAENNSLWADWTEEHATAVRLQRKNAKLTKRLKKKGGKA